MKTKLKIHRVLRMQRRLRKMLINEVQTVFAMRFYYIAKVTAGIIGCRLLINKLNKPNAKTQN